MAISKIKAENFTVFDELEIDFIDGINVFIGDNGTGKTHLLKALYSTCQWKMKDLEYEYSDPTFAERILKCFQDIPMKDLVSNSSESRAIHVEIVIDGVENNYSIWGISNQIKVAYDSDQSRHAEEPYPAVFIPAKEMLTHGRLEKDYSQRNLPFDITLIDIINKAGVSTIKMLPDEMKSILDDIAKIIGGKVVYRNARFYIERSDGTFMDFAVVAEGFKKLGLIYRLIETGYFVGGSVLFWDEPEANLNPKLIPILVEILLKLERAGVQVFLATHDYFFAKFLDVRKKKENKVAYHAFYFEDGKLLHERQKEFELLKYNSIIEQSIALYKEEIEKVMG